jgi:hypothetical protein
MFFKFILFHLFLLLIYVNFLKFKNIEKQIKVTLLYIFTRKNNYSQLSKNKNIEKINFNIFWL